MASRPFTPQSYSFQGQIGCANCHIDSTFDGLTWDLEPDGMGRNIVDNRLLESLKGTEPFKWNGGNPDIPTECGPRTEKYFWRSENYDDLTLTDLAIYILQPACQAESLQAAGLRTQAGRRRAARQSSSGKPTNSATRFRLATAARIATAAPREPARNHSMWARRKTTDDSGLLDTPQLTQHRAHRTVSSRRLGAHA